TLPIPARPTLPLRWRRASPFFCYNHAPPPAIYTLSLHDALPIFLYEADIHSPYEQLWSLPVRVRDPELTQFVRVLEGPRAPDWVVTRGRSTDSWGIEASTADDALAARYDVVADLRGYRIHLLKGTERPVPATP